MCVFSPHLFWTSSSLGVPAGVTQEEGHTGFLIHLPSAVRALIFLASRIQPFLSLVDREVEFCLIVLRGQTSPGEERGNETGKVAIAHGSVEFCETTPIGLADES